MKTDIVYIVGTGSKWNNNELRFSLRSLEKYGKNIGRIIIAGECPAWIEQNKVIYVPCKDETSVKHTNILRKILHVVKTLKMTKPFLISSDDHFYSRTTDFETYPHYWRGILPETSGSGEYKRSIYQTRLFLEKNELGVKMTNPHCNTWIDPKALKKLAPIIEASGAKDGIEVNCVMGNYLEKQGVKLTKYEDQKKKIPMGYNTWIRYTNRIHCFSIADTAIDINFSHFMMAKYPNKSSMEKDNVTIKDIFSPYIARQLRKR